MSPPRRNALPWLLLSAAVIALDQLTKALVVAHFAPGRTRVLIPHLLDLTLAYNRGAAFNFLASADGWQRWLFTAGDLRRAGRWPWRVRAARPARAT